ncbi:MAG: hypothetical protein ACI8P9_005085 [Parasphingorhabdus sp.]|jgi:hypothetical protein
MIKVPKKLEKYFKKEWDSIPISSHLEMQVLELLVAYYYKRTLKPAESDNAIENLRVVHHVSLMDNDLAIKLCRLRDRDNRSICFEQAIKKYKRKIRTERVDRLKTILDEFRNVTKEIKTTRDTKIAHFSKKYDGTMPEYEDYEVGIEKAVQFVDELKGKKCEYYLFDMNLRQH